MGKTYHELQKELSNTKTGLQKARKRVSILNHHVLKYKNHAKRLVLQYERVITEYKKMLEDYKKNIAKFFFLSLFNKIREKIKGVNLL